MVEQFPQDTLQRSRTNLKWRSCGCGRGRRRCYHRALPVALHEAAKSSAGRQRSDKLAADHAISAVALLYHVRKFMGQKPVPFARSGRIFSFSKYNVASHGVSPGTERDSGLGCPRIRVDANVAEFMPHSGLKVVARFWGKRSSWS